jgi:hypothetical protein
VSDYFASNDVAPDCQSVGKSCIYIHTHIYIYIYIYIMHYIYIYYAHTCENVVIVYVHVFHLYLAHTRSNAHSTRRGYGGHAYEQNGSSAPAFCLHACICSH